MRIYINRELYESIGGAASHLGGLGIEVAVYPDTKTSTRREALEKLRGSLGIEKGSILVIDAGNAADTAVPFAADTEQASYIILLPPPDASPDELGRAAAFIREFFYEKIEDAEKTLIAGMRDIRVSYKMLANTLIAVSRAPAPKGSMLLYRFKRILVAQRLRRWLEEAKDALSSMSREISVLYEAKLLNEYVQRVSEYLSRRETRYTVIAENWEEAAEKLKTLIENPGSLTRIAWLRNREPGGYEAIVLGDNEALKHAANTITLPLFKDSVYINMFSPIPVEEAVENGKPLIEPLATMLEAAPGPRDILVEEAAALPPGIYTRRQSTTIIRSALEELMRKITEARDTYRAILSCEPASPTCIAEARRLQRIHSDLREIADKIPHIIQQIPVEDREKLRKLINETIEIYDENLFEIRDKIDIIEDELGFPGIATMDNINSLLRKIRRALTG